MRAADSPDPQQHPECPLPRTRQSTGEQRTAICRGFGTPNSTLSPRCGRVEPNNRVLECVTVFFVQARHYYQIIKRPMDLSVIRAKLNKRNSQHYHSPDQFIADVFLMFRNCAKFNYVGSTLGCVQGQSAASNSASLSAHSPTRRWPRQAAVCRCSSSPNSEGFFQTERSLWPRTILTATSTTRPTGQRGAGSPGPRGGSSATGRGRGEIPSSPEDTTSEIT